MSLITVAASIGCGARSVSQKAAEGLKLELYDDERLQQDAFNMGYSMEGLKGFDEKSPGLFDRLLRRQLNRSGIYGEIITA